MQLLPTVLQRIKNDDQLSFLGKVSKRRRQNDTLPGGGGVVAISILHPKTQIHPRLLIEDMLLRLRQYIIWRVYRSLYILINVHIRSSIGYSCNFAECYRKVIDQYANMGIEAAGMKRLAFLYR